MKHFTGGTKITGSATYSTDGNRLISTKDALDNTTTYCYNENTNVLEWVEYPKDTEDNRTEYTYDAWGKVLSQTGSMAWSLGKENPLRYRGYVYDQETDLYYLQSRYYDPKIGRFINADAFTSTGQGVIGNNMFAYCLNNPVNNLDSSGTVAVSIFDGDRNSLSIGYIGLGGGGTGGRGGFARKASSRDQKNGLIHGQSAFQYSEEAVGLGSYANSGCAVIATYNAMQLLGENASLGAIRDEYLYKHGAILFGLGGVGPWRFDDYFESHGINCTGYFSYTSLNANISEGDVVVFTVMNNRDNILEGFHTMTAQYIGGTYLVYNVYSNSTTYSTCRNLSNIYSDARWIYGYIVGG